MSETKTTFAVMMTTPQGEFSFRCPADEFVLQAGLDQGIDLPYMCLQGWCITCAAKILQGRVDQSASRRYFAAANILCSSTSISCLMPRRQRLNYFEVGSRGRGSPIGTRAFTVPGRAAMPSLRSAG